MEILRQQLARVQTQLAGLSASQKMLTASLLAIMVMTFLWWGKYAGTSEMEPLFQQSLSPEELGHIHSVLQSEQIPSEISGDKILISGEKRDYAVAALGFAQALPKDSSGSFDEMLKNMNPFDAPSKDEKLYNQYNQEIIAKYVGLWKGIASARVLMDPTHDIVIGGSVDPSASVSVQTSEGAPPHRKLAQALASFVAGSNAHMKPSRVTVLIDGVLYHAIDPNPNAPDSDIDDQRVQFESHCDEEVKTALSLYGNVVAVVHASVDLVSSHKTATTHQNPIVKEKSSDSESSSTKNGSIVSAEPGVAPNSGVTLPQGGPSGGANTETERNKTENEIIVDQTQEELIKPAGEAKAISAAVSVPRTAFIQELKGTDTSAKPTARDIDALFASRRDEIVTTVMNAIGIADPKQVSVSLGPDAPLLLATGAGLSSTSTGTGGALSFTGHVKEIAVGLLALVSLFMVSMMVKKTAPIPVIDAPVETAGPTTLGGNYDIAGEVAEGGQTLDGMELDEDAVKSQQMVEQVSTMVKENPEAAATLVKRWLNRT